VAQEYFLPQGAEYPRYATVFDGISASFKEVSSVEAGIVFNLFLIIKFWAKTSIVLLSGA